MSNKRNRSTRTDPINLPRRLREGLAEAQELLDARKPVQAKQLLEELLKDFPRQEDALGLFANTCLDTKDSRGYLHAINRLQEIRPNNPEYYLGLAGGYLDNGFFVLALQHFERFVHRWPGHPKADEARKAIQAIQDGLHEHILSELRLDEHQALAFAAKHEELRFSLETRQFQRGKMLANELLKIKPDFAPARNNLSQIYWLEGDNHKAIEICEQVLTLEPDNIHALSNIIRLLYIAGRKGEAPAYLARLIASKAEAADRWNKIAEVLSFIGDDQGMLELKARAQSEARPMELNEYFHHFAAVSELILGREDEAKADWKHALKLQHGFTPAQENLEDLKRPRHKRNGPWAHTMAELVSAKTIRDLVAVIQRAARNNNDQAIESATQHFLNAHPEIIQLAPLFLERGEPMAKELVLKIADISAHPNFLALLKDFAFGQTGSDELRLAAAQILSKYNAAPSGLVKMWIKGKWTEILLLGFEITPEPIFDHPIKPKALTLLTQAITALHNNDGRRAEQYLRQALAIQPKDPSLLNNLALALFMQDKKNESEAIRKTIVEEFPDYFLGQISQARKFLEEGELEQARSIIDRWMETKKKYHVTEFSAMCKAQIHLSIQDGKLDGAVSWLEMWERAYPDDPEFEHYKQLFNLRKGLSKLQPK